MRNVLVMVMHATDIAEDESWDFQLSAGDQLLITEIKVDEEIAKYDRKQQRGEHGLGQDKKE